MQFILPLILILQCFARKNVYKKPNPSNGPCIENIENMQDTLNSLEATEFCLGCATAQRYCLKTPNCQNFIDNMYSLCKGVTLPMSYYYDYPMNTIDGTFDSEDVQRRLRLSVEKCGCRANSSFSQSISLLSKVLCGVVLLCGLF